MSAPYTMFTPHPLLTRQLFHSRVTRSASFQGAHFKHFSMVDEGSTGPISPRSRASEGSSEPFGGLFAMYDEGPHRPTS